MNKSEIKEIKAFYSSKNKKQPQTASIPEIHAQDINTNAMSFFNAVINKLKINKSTSKK